LGHDEHEVKSLVSGGLSQRTCCPLISRFQGSLPQSKDDAIMPGYRTRQRRTEMPMRTETHGSLTVHIGPAKVLFLRDGRQIIGHRITPHTNGG
jgi:hypothetical protein